MADIPSNVSKRNLWRYVNKKIKRIIHHYHVFSIISLLFDEMLKDLKQGKSIKVVNFGTLSLKETKPRLYHDVNKRQVVLSKKHKILRFELSPKIRKKMCEHLDIDKTFESD